MSLSSFTVLITGAGSGLGQALALAYANTGAFVYCTDRHFEKAEGTLEKIQAAGGQGQALHLDVSREDSFTALLPLVADLDVLINNAGVAANGTLLDTSPDTWDWVLNINLLGVVRGCRHFLPKMKTGGHIVNIASFAGIANGAQMGAYNVSKAGVISLSETLRHETHAQGLGVTVVCPAYFPTQLMKDAVVDDERTRARVERWMKSSGVTAEGVAQSILQAVQKRQFLLLTHRDTFWLWRLKRASLSGFFRAMDRLSQPKQSKRGKIAAR
jgi:NAD(P)-dependent dehydrogenase (short-subunit alcohol dehydrogenase family)